MYYVCFSASHIARLQFVCVCTATHPAALQQISFCIDGQRDAITRNITAMCILNVAKFAEAANILDKIAAKQ